MNSHRRKVLVSLLGAALLSVPANALAQESRDEERVITFVKGTPAKDLDSALPKMRFERWLKDVAGPKAELTWELNDCGEQTGDPAVDSKRDIPACVGVSGKLADGRIFQVLISVGTAKKIGGRPALRSILVQWKRRLAEVKRLRDLPPVLAPEPQK